MMVRDFMNVDMKYRGTDLWMLNDKLEEKELERQIEEMSKKGCGSFITRTFRGLKSDYPGEEFMGKMRVIINKAKETGMKIFLQAGYMPGGIPDLPEEYTHTVIKVAEANAEGIPTHDIIAEKGGKIYYTDRVMYFLDLLNPDAVRYYMKISYTDVWERFADEFGKTIVSVWVDEPHFNPPLLPWTKKLPEQFRKMWGYSLEENIRLLLEREGDYRTVRYHYWRTILHILKNSYFEEVKRWCNDHNLKFSGHLMGEDTFERQIGFSCSVMPLYKYMDIPGIDHLTNSMEWPRGGSGGMAVKFLMTPLQCISAARQAGKEDILCEMYGVSAQGITFARQKYIFDYFMSLGINYRCVHARFYSMKGERKRFYAPHMSYQQPWWEYYRKETDYSARVSWFVHQGRPMSDILVMNPVESAFMEYDSLSSVNRTDTVNKEQTRSSEITRMNQRFATLLRDMMGKQLVFDLGDEDTLAEWGSVLEDGTLKVGEMVYRTVVIPDFKVIRGSTIEILKQFAAKGGTILVKGETPKYVDGRPDERFTEMNGVKMVDDTAALLGILEEGSIKDYRYESDDDCTSIWINMRETDNGRTAFIFNVDDTRERKGVLTIKGMYNVQVWNAEDGTVSDADTCVRDNATMVKICLEPGGSTMLVFERTEKLLQDSGCCANVSNMAETPQVIQSLKLSDNWNIRRKDPNALVLEFCRYRKKDGDYSEIYPVLAVQQILTREDYKGPVTLKFEFDVSHVPENIKLVAEEPDKYEILVNNRPIKTDNPEGYYKDKSFKVVDISGTIKEGLNTIEATRYFEPMEKPKSVLISLFKSLSGVELESMYLIGDFGVYGTAEPTDTGFIRYSKTFSIGKEATRVGNEITLKGYPFYSGTVVLSKEFTLDNIPENRRALLTIDNFNACAANIRINGNYAGTLCWRPLETDITGMLRQGRNTLEIELVNSLRNLLGPYHQPQGDESECWSNAWTADYDRDTGRRHPDWYLRRDPDTMLWTDSYMQSRFGIAGVKVNFIE
jgi:hypothetical protein